jgi:hypothetical protein
MAKKDEQSIELSFEVESGEAISAINSVTKTALESNKLISKLNALSSKRFKTSQMDAIKITKELNDALKETGFSNIDNSKKALRFQNRALKINQQIRKDQEILAKVQDGRNIGKAENEAAERIQANIKKLKTETVKYNRDMQGFQKANEAVAEYEKQLRSQATFESDDEDSLKKRNQLIDKELGNLKEQLSTLENIEDSSERQSKLEEIRLKYSQQSAKVALKTQTKSFLSGVADKLSGGMSGKGVKVREGMVDTAKTFSKLAGVGGKLGGVFKVLSGVVSTLTNVLGGWAFALGGILIAADAAQKEINRNLAKGIGSAGLSNRDILDLNEEVNKMSYAQNPMLVNNLRLTSEEIQNTMNALMQSGMSVKNLVGGYKDLTRATEISATAARNFGLDIEEGGKIVGEYYSSYAKGIDSIQDTFATLNHDIKNSSMTANNFLSVIQSVSAQFNIFVDQTKTFSKVLSDLGSRGGYSQKQIAKMMDTLAGFSTKGMDEGFRRMALSGGAYRKQAQIELKEIQKQIEGGIGGMSEAERNQLFERQRYLQEIEKGGTLRGGAAIERGLGVAGEVKAMLNAQKLNTNEDLDKAIFNPERLKVMGAMYDRSAEDMRTLLSTVQTLAIQTGKTPAEVMSSAEFDKNFKAQLEATEEAKNIASRTVTAISGAGDMTNNILVSIANLLEEAVNVILDLFGWKGNREERDKRLKNARDTEKNQERLRSEAERLIQQSKERAYSNQTSAAGSDIKKSMYYYRATPEQKKNMLKENMISPSIEKQDGLIFPRPETKPEEFNPWGTMPFDTKGGTFKGKGSTGSWDDLPEKKSTTYIEDGAKNKTANQAGTSQGQTVINIDAVLQLENGEALKTIVKKINYEQQRNS